MAPGCRGSSQEGLGEQMSVASWLSLGAVPQTYVLHPSDSQTQNALPLLSLEFMLT